MEQLKILIADDSEFMRIAYKRILESHSNFRVVAMASNGEEAVQQAAESGPDVAILDIRMPKVDGIRVAHEILKRRPGTAIVIISAYDDLSFVADLMQNGAANKAYLLKNSLSDISELIRIVEAVNQGHTVLDSGIVHKMARLYCKHSDVLQTTLTDMEQDLLGLMRRATTTPISAGRCIWTKNGWKIMQDPSTGNSALTKGRTKSGA